MTQAASRNALIRKDVTRTSVIRRVLGAPGAQVGAALLAMLVLAAAFAPLLAPHDWNETRVCARLAAPSATHPFGCDLYGRDLFSRVLYGSRYPLLVGAGTVAISLVFGGTFGMASALAGGRADAAGVRASDVLLGFPPIVMAILVMAILVVAVLVVAVFPEDAAVPW